MGSVVSSETLFVANLEFRDEDLIHMVMVWRTLGQDQCVGKLQKEYRERINRGHSKEIAAYLLTGGLSVEEYGEALQLQIMVLDVFETGKSNSTDIRFCVLHILVQDWMNYGRPKEALRLQMRYLEFEHDEGRTVMLENPLLPWMQRRRFDEARCLQTKQLELITDDEKRLALLLGYTDKWRDMGQMAEAGRLQTYHLLLIKSQ